MTTGILGPQLGIKADLLTMVTGYSGGPYDAVKSWST